MRFFLLKNILSECRPTRIGFNDQIKNIDSPQLSSID